MCVCVHVLNLVDSAFTSITIMAAICYHRRCVFGCAHVASPTTGGVSL